MKLIEYIDEAKNKLGLTSDYAFAQKLDIPRSKISEIRSDKRNNADKYFVEKLAEILEMDSRIITADLESQTEKNPKKKEFWLTQVASGGIKKIRNKLIELRIIHIMLN